MVAMTDCEHRLDEWGACTQCGAWGESVQTIIRDKGLAYVGEANDA